MGAYDFLAKNPKRDFSKTCANPMSEWERFSDPVISQTTNHPHFPHHPRFPVFHVSRLVTWQPPGPVALQSAHQNGLCSRPDYNTITCNSSMARRPHIIIIGRTMQHECATRLTWNINTQAWSRLGPKFHIFRLSHSFKGCAFFYVYIILVCFFVCQCLDHLFSVGPGTST